MTPEQSMHAQWAVEVPKADNDTLLHALRAINAKAMLSLPPWLEPWQLEMIKAEVVSRALDGRIPSPLPDIVAMLLMSEAIDA